MSKKRVCPVCGDYRFGSTQLPDGTLERMCHGTLPDGSNCTHTWHESQDAENGLVDDEPSTEGVGQVVR